jgi:hypothetical protein
MSKVVTAVQRRAAGDGMTQGQLEDVLAQLAVLQGKVAALSDRLGLCRESVYGPAGRPPDAEWPSRADLLMPSGLGRAERGPLDPAGRVLPGTERGQARYRVDAVEDPQRGTQLGY